jgi:serine/threonine protein kinase
MIKIEDKPAYNLYKNKNSFSYCLSIKEENTYNKIFIPLLVNQIPNSFYNELQNAIIFTAESATSLTSKIVKSQTIQMIKCLCEQLEYLHKNNLAFYGFDMDDIIVINETQFIIINNKYIQTIDSSNSSLTFYSPFSKPYFSSPELKNLKCLPANIDYRTSYYSLGALIVFYLFDYKLPSENDTKRENQEDEDEAEDKVFESILNTKLYWFLKRCLNDNPKKRILLFL